MIHSLSVLDWLSEAEEPTAVQAPMTGAPTPGQDNTGTPPPPQEGSPDQQPQADTPDPDKSPDTTKDPVDPDMPEEPEHMDFEEWRTHYFELAIKGDVNEMLDWLKVVANRDLDATQDKFVWDNTQIQYIRQDNTNILGASNELRRQIKNQIDKNYPAMAVSQYLMMKVEEAPALLENFYKLPGFGGGKSDVHRKVLAGLLGAVQIGGGGNSEDLVISEKGYSINLSTRMSTEWGQVPLGQWSLQMDDPQRYLEEPELERLHNGSPEERHVMRHRVVLDSIAEKFRQRGFVIHVVAVDGTIYTLGWDLGDSLLAGYTQGKLIVRSRVSDAAEAMIDDEGNVIPITDLSILYVRQSHKKDDTGAPAKQELPFIERMNGTLYLTADVETIRDLQGLPGVFYRESPYNGHPGDIKRLRRAVPTVSEMLARKS